MSDLLQVFERIRPVASKLITNSGVVLHVAKRMDDARVREY